MAETIGKIKDIKLGTWLKGSVNAFDVCIMTIRDTSNVSWAMYLWNARADVPVLDRILQTQRLALAREAALKQLTVHLWHESDSSIVDQIKVDFP